jgi:hypothetical protein
MVIIGSICPGFPLLAKASISLAFSPFDLMFFSLILARQGVCAAGLSHDLQIMWRLIFRMKKGRDRMTPHLYYPPLLLEVT